MSRSRFILSGFGVAILVAIPTVGLAVPAGAEQCQTFRWSNSAGTKLMTSGPSSVSTGISLGEGRIDSMAYSSSDGYEGRRDVQQSDERWFVTVGGTQVGAVTADVPDPTDDDSASTSGNLGGGSTSGGDVSIVHISQAHGVATQESVFPLSLTIVWCEPDPTPPTTDLAPAAPAAPTTPGTAPIVASADPVVPATSPTVRLPIVLTEKVLPATGPGSSRGVLLVALVTLLAGSIFTVAAKAAPRRR